MHRFAIAAGTENLPAEGIIFINQTPAPLIFLTAADTDIQTLATVIPHLPESLRNLRAVNILQLQQQLSIDHYAESVLAQARIIILRLLGGRSYWSYGLEVVKETVQTTGAALIVIPGDDHPDPDLISHSTVSLPIVNQIWRYFAEGGKDNFLNALKFVADVCDRESYHPPHPQPIPQFGLYSGPNQAIPTHLLYPKVGIIFYRAHYLAGNLAPIDALCQELLTRKLQPIPVFVSSLRTPEIQAELAQYFQPTDSTPIQLLLNTTSFSISGNLHHDHLGVNDRGKKLVSAPPLFSRLNIPTLQVIFSSETLFQWESGVHGLSPRDLAINIALPEVDGNIISRAVSFKAVQNWHPVLQTNVVGYVPHLERINFVADLAANWVRLRLTSPSNRKIALILANYPCRDGRLANGVGLDTPASCIEILQALRVNGYDIDHIPNSGDELIKDLTSGVTNDPEGKELRSVRQYLTLTEYQTYFATLPMAVQTGISDRWSLPQEQEKFPIAGIQLGNIFVGIQPSRGYDLDPSLNYHAPDLEPPHAYLAFYDWIRENFGAHAIVHLGKHGNLEWLPGKSVALSAQCYPEVAHGCLPHFYPFIVNDPGEGSQAKRRANAVIIDHLTPPMTRAELYGPLQQLESLMDEYYQAESLDPSRLPLIRERIVQLVIQEKLDQDLGIKLAEVNHHKSLLENRLDAYLCELKEAQIRDGLHIFGQCPQGRQLRDLIVAIARHPGKERLGITRALAQDLGLDFDPLTVDLTLTSSPITIFDQSWTRISDVIAVLEEKAAELVEELIHQSLPSINIHQYIHTQRELQWISDRLLPALQQTNQEIVNLLRGLNGDYVPSGPAGAPTRGRPDVLPTGVNFYSVDIRAIPTETAWSVGKIAAENLIERYVQEHGEYPKTVGLSVWGTSTMRTGGDDIAEAIALLGVQPVWDQTIEKGDRSRNYRSLCFRTSKNRCHFANFWFFPRRFCEFNRFIRSRGQSSS